MIFPSFPTALFSALVLPGFIRKLKLGALCLLFFCAQASADQVAGIRAQLTNPIALRGGVLLVALAAERPGDRWPSTIPLILADGRSIAGQVIWMESQSEREEARWTEDPRQIAVRAIDSSDDSSLAPPGAMVGPYLAARMPDDAEGVVHFVNQTLRPQWIDMPLGFGDASSSELSLPGTASPGLPDTESPFAYWRWHLVAQKQGMKAPDLNFNASEVFVADYYAALWGIGMNRLAAVDATLGRDCLELLTRTCSDRGKPFAAWEANPRRLGELLGMLLNFDLPEGRIREQIRNWVSLHEPLLFWIEAEHSDFVRVAMVNTTRQEIIPRFLWIHTPDIPSAVPIEPGELMHVRIERVVQETTGPLKAVENSNQQAHVLLIEYGDRQYRLAFPPRSIEAKPPGVGLDPFQPPLTLGELQMRRSRSMSEESLTRAHLRRQDGRWEIFFECRRPRDRTTFDGASANQSLSAYSSYADVRHIESVSLLIGDEEADGGPAIVLTVPELGPWRLFRGAGDGTLEIHRQSYDDRWYCRVVVPERWLSPREGPFTLVGCLRSHADSAQIESFPRSGVPWQLSPGRLTIDLSVWTDRPAFLPSGGR